MYITIINTTFNNKKTRHTISIDTNMHTHTHTCDLMCLVVISFSSITNRSQFRFSFTGFPIRLKLCFDSYFAFGDKNRECKWDGKKWSAKKLAITAFAVNGILLETQYSQISAKVEQFWWTFFGFQVFIDCWWSCDVHQLLFPLLFSTVSCIFYSEAKLCSIDNNVLWLLCKYQQWGLTMSNPNLCTQKIPESTKTQSNDNCQIVCYWLLLCFVIPLFETAFYIVF